MTETATIEPEVDELETATIGSVADLLESLGGIPAARVRWKPTLGTATEADVLIALEAPRKRICELVDGILIEKAMGFREALLAVFIGEKLNGYVRSRNLGLVTGADGTLKLWAGRVRIPDIAFTSWDRMPGRRCPTQPIPLLCPDLAIEVISSTNTVKEMKLRRFDYFTAGVRVVWEVDPVDRTLTVYTSAEEMTDYAANDIVPGDPVLPGFSLSLAEVFAELDRVG